MRNKEPITYGCLPITQIEEANIGKRLLANIIDALFFVFVSVLLYLVAFQPISNVAFNYSDTLALGTQYQVASHLYAYEQEGDSKYEIIEVKDFSEKLDVNKYSRLVLSYQYDLKDYTFYLKRLHYYYCSYLTNVNVELPNNTPTKTFDPVLDNFVAPTYNEKINGLLPKDIFTNEYFSNVILKINDDKSFFKIDDSKQNYLDSIILKDESKLDDAIYFLKESLYNATSDFYKSNYFDAINNKVKRIQLFNVIGAVCVSYGVFFIMFPLIFHDGQTLGKKLNHLCVISSSGYKAKKRQIVFRELLLFIILLFSAFVVGVGLTSIATAFLAIFILLVFTLISRNHKAPHDYAAVTLVINETNSVFFLSEEDERKHFHELNEKMEKYKKIKVENKNIIQIGAEIIDKKENEEDKNVESKK